jgi:hypothetical protein
VVGVSLGLGVAVGAVVGRSGTRVGKAAAAVTKIGVEEESDVPVGEASALPERPNKR